MQYLINTPMTVVLTSEATDGYTFITNGVSTPYVYTNTPVSSSVSSITFSPTAGGSLYIVDNTNNDVSGPYEIVSLLNATQLQSIADGILGSYYWDKIQNVLTLYTQSGVVLATYSVQDTEVLSSRELTS